MAEYAFITGAGISAAAGIPTYRNQLGEYTHPAISGALTKDAFEQDPGRVWSALHEITRPYQEKTVSPTAGHLAIARHEQTGINSLVITQNIDDLHERAGSTGVAHLHGELTSAYCPCCATTYSVNPSNLPRSPVCNNDNCTSDEPAILHPGVVLNRERPRWAALKAMQQLSSSELECLFIIGTHATYPYIRRAIQKVRTETNAKITEINPNHTKVSHLAHQVIRATADEVLPELLYF